MFQIIFKIQPLSRAPDVVKSPQARYVSVWHSINMPCLPIFCSSVLSFPLPVYIWKTVTTSSFIFTSWKPRRREPESGNNSQLDRFGPGVSSRLDGALRQGSWGLSAGCSGGPASAGYLRVRLPCRQLHMSTKIPLFKCLLPGFPNPLIECLF